MDVFEKRKIDSKFIKRYKLRLHKFYFILVSKIHSTIQNTSRMNWERTQQTCGNFRLLPPSALKCLQLRRPILLPLWQALSLVWVGSNSQRNYHDNLNPSFPCFHLADCYSTAILVDKDDSCAQGTLGPLLTSAVI